MPASINTLVTAPKFPRYFPYARVPFARGLNLRARLHRRHLAALPRTTARQQPHHHHRLRARASHTSSARYSWYGSSTTRLPRSLPLRPRRGAASRTEHTSRSTGRERRRLAAGPSTARLHWYGHDGCPDPHAARCDRGVRPRELTADGAGAGAVGHRAGGVRGDDGAVLSTSTGETQRREDAANARARSSEEDGCEDTAFVLVSGAAS